MPIEWQSCTFAKRKRLKNENMTIQEYVEAHGYKVSDLTKKELKEVEKELLDVENGFEVLDGFFGPMSEFTQRMIQG